ncbi:MAG: effector binding domain-containing protein [Chloroflexota bacterium]|nr:effector binding domain-containing protein [Chloroflexota bacterium]
MNMLKITRLEPCKVVSFHVKGSLTPEEEVFALFRNWAQTRGLLEKHRFLPVLGFNNPWGPEGKPRGYEIWCFLEDLSDLNLYEVTVKDFPGGLFGVSTVPGLDVIPEFVQQLRQAIDSHPRYETDYPAGYRHGIDPVPEYELIYTPNARRMEDFVLDYFIPIKGIK